MPGTNLQLSPHFRLNEFCDTWRTEYVERNWELGSQEPYLSNMKKLCVDILEPLRAHFLSPVTISSGLRYSEQDADGNWMGLDFAIRTIRQRKTYDGRSQHRCGEAADIHVSGIQDREVFEWLRNFCPKPFGQIIFEVSGRTSWVHVSIPGTRIDSRGGGSIYGEIWDAFIDQMGRTYYTKTEERNW